jgi:chitin-binding protein
MATQDPMCWQAWQYNSNAMWNWNGLYVENLQGNYQSAIPDGTICSAGHTGDGRYNSLDVPGQWVAQPVSNNFTVKVHDQALHGADFYRLRDGLAEGEADGEPVGPPGKIPSGGPSTSPTPGTPGACSATYAVTGQWAGGFQADVRVTASPAAIRGWTVSWTFANGQQVSQVWNATVTTSGATVTARNASYNGSLGAGASSSFGFIGAWNGTNSVPTPTCTAI